MAIQELGEELLLAARDNNVKRMKNLLDPKSKSGTARVNYHSKGRQAIHLGMEQKDNI